MPKIDPTPAPQAPAAAPAPATPAAPAATAPQTSGATTASPSTAPPASSAPIDVQALAEQLADARETGQTRRAEELKALIAGRSVANAEADPEPEVNAAPVVPAGETPGDPADTAAGDGTEGNEENGEGEADGEGQPEGEGESQQQGPSSELPDRVRLGHMSPEDRADMVAINALTRKGLSLAKATEIIMGGQARMNGAGDEQNDFAGDPAPAGQPAQQYQAAPSQALAEMEAEVLQLEQQLEEQGANEGQFNTRIAKITAQLSKANARLEAQRWSDQSAAREAQREQVAHSTQVKASEAQTFGRFPALQDKKSPLYARWLEKCLAANHPSHPDHERSWAADAPAYFAAKAAEELGIQPKATNGRTAAVPPASAVRGPANGAARPNGAAPVTRPAPGTRTSSPPPAPKTSAQRVEEKLAEVEAVETGRKMAPRIRIGGMITI